MIKDKQEIKKVWKELHKRIKNQYEDYPCPRLHINESWSCCNCAQEFGFIDGLVRDDFFVRRPIPLEHYYICTDYGDKFALLFSCPCIGATDRNEVLLHLEQITDKKERLPND